MRKYFWLILLPILTLMLGLYIGNFSLFSIDEKSEDSATVILNQIRQVTKLVTVEGSFSEIYSFDNYWGFNLEGFKKKALVRVTADVLVGYDLENMEIKVDKDNNRIIISHIPDPEIMSVEKNVEYYDLKEGVFNQFNEKDFTKIDKRVDGFLRGVVKDSDLFDMAEDQLRNILQSMSLIASQSDYILVWEHGNSEYSSELK